MGYEPHAETSSPFVVKTRGEVSARFDGMGEAPERLAARSGYRVTGREDDGDYRVRVFERV